MCLADSGCGQQIFQNCAARNSTELNLFRHSNDRVTQKVVLFECSPPLVANTYLAAASCRLFSFRPQAVQVSGLLYS